MKRFITWLLLLGSLPSFSHKLETTACLVSLRSEGKLFRPPTVQTPSMVGKAFLSKLSKEHIRVATFNLKNWGFDKSDLDLGSTTKPKEEVDWIEKIISDVEPDVLVGQELSRIEQFQKFVDERFPGVYDTAMKAGNDTKNIFFLFRRGLNLTARLDTNRELKWVSPEGKTQNLFTRDAPVLLLFERDSLRPRFAFVGVHAIASTNRKNRVDDPTGVYRREREYKMIAKIGSDLDKKYGIPVFILGDFNSDLLNGHEVNPIRELFKNTIELKRPGLPRAGAPYTHTYAYRTENGVSIRRQVLDGAWVTPNFSHMIKQTFIYQYYDRDGLLIPPVKSFEEIASLPSDHSMYVFDFDPGSIWLPGEWTI